MICVGYTKIWDLASGELVKLEGARGTTLRVTRGTLWLTQEHDTRDFVLTAGDVYTIDRGGLTLVEAQSNASVCVMSHHVEETRVAPAGRSFRAQVQGWLESVGTGAMARRWVPYL